MLVETDGEKGGGGSGEGKMTIGCACMPYILFEGKIANIGDRITPVILAEFTMAINTVIARHKMAMAAIGVEVAEASDDQVAECITGAADHYRKHGNLGFSETERH